MAEEIKNEEEKKDISIGFSKSQIHNEQHTKTFPSGKQMTFTNVDLPSKSDYKGYHIEVPSARIHQSKDKKTGEPIENKYFAYISADYDIAATKTDKDNKLIDRQMLKPDEVKKQFDAWKENTKTAPAENKDDGPEMDL